MSLLIKHHATLTSSLLEDDILGILFVLNVVEGSLLLILTQAFLNNRKIFLGTSFFWGSFIYVCHVYDKWIFD